MLALTDSANPSQSRRHNYYYCVYDTRPGDSFIIINKAVEESLTLHVVPI